MQTFQYVALAEQLIALLTRADTIEMRLETLSRTDEDFSIVSQRLMLSRLVNNVSNQLTSLTAKLGHCEAAVLVLSRRFDQEQIAGIRNQIADSLAYKYAFGDNVTNEDVIIADLLEVEEMLPVLAMIVERCSTRLWSLLASTSSAELV